MNRKYLQYLLMTVLAAGSFYLLQTYYPRIHPLSQTDFSVTEEQAVESATTYLPAKYQKQDMDNTSGFIIDKKYFERPAAETQSIIKAIGIQPFRYWKMEFSSSATRRNAFSFTSGEEQAVKAQTNNSFLVHLSPKGKLLQLDFEQVFTGLLKDSLAKSGMPVREESEADARKESFAFLQKNVTDTSSLQTVKSEIKADSIFNIYQFDYAGKIKSQNVYYTIKVLQGQIIYYDFSLTAPGASSSGSFSDEMKGAVAFGIYEVIIIVLLIICILIYFIRFSRQDFISFKISLPVVYVVAVSAAVSSFFQISTAHPWVQIAMVIVSVLFQSIGILLLYTISDAMARQQWTARLSVTDSFYQGKFFTLASGRAVIKGIALGVIALSWYALSLYIYSRLLGEILRMRDNLTYSFVFILPTLALSLGYLVSTLFHEYFYRLFAISLLRAWLKKTVWIIAAGTFIGLFFRVDLEAANLLLKLISLVIPAMLFAYFLVRYNIFTTIVGYFTFLLLSQAVIFTKTQEPYFQQLGTGFYFILGALLFSGLITIWIKRNEAGQPLRFVPEYVRKRDEKKRLIRELDIARTVQQQFLPKDTPRIPNYQIAASCQPAWEVGGDYYDYFPMDDHSLGIVIGDVSNKGISAAFFMTLVKGFLKSLTRHYSNPSDILRETNRLFYKDVERGYFISMIFGILNTETGTFSFARAGHNPLLYLVERDGAGKWLTPPGVGIGLLPPEKFDQTIFQQDLKLQPGDAVVLYTDGYPEAMNNSLEEFGEDRLRAFLEKNSEKPPHQIIKMLESNIGRWEGDQPARDDRTIVVIKRME